MRKFFAISTFLCSSSVIAIESNPCVIVGSSVDVPIFNAMINEMGVKRESIVAKKTKLELLENKPVNKLLAMQMAKSDEKKLSFVKYKDLISIYQNDNPRNLIIKYTYENTDGKHNVFIGSAIVNNNECSVGFNGYIVVEREF
ncbi:Uncharacterised protein [Serratia quinivorans]|uniref:hypothetical protein n=1 Tax=Serratia quinivorans TaxID=137545 RepID=UPI00217BECA7|nr:hypothetical protein [Serratia quinivorans]CAI1732579.1 Uncharacterised protein [Serratia quinivorans]